VQQNGKEKTMTLTTFDPVKGCNVLNPAAFVVNAFHPDYVKTHMPDLLKEFRTHLANREERVEKKLKVKKTPLKTVTKSMQILTKREQRKSMADVKAELDRKMEGRLDLAKKKELILKPKDFKYFSAAGANNVRPKGKK
jgi:hypothetical protein